MKHSGNVTKYRP